MTPVCSLSAGPAVVLVGPVDDAFALEVVALALRVTEPLEDLDAVLTDHRRRTVDLARRLGEVDERAELAHAAEDRVVVLGDEAEAFVVTVEHRPLARVRV